MYVTNSTAVCWVATFHGIYPAISINLLLVAVIANLTKVMISHAKSPSV